MAAELLNGQAGGYGGGYDATGKKGAKAQALAEGGIAGLAASDALDLCVLDNCFGGGGAIALGKAKAGAYGGAFPDGDAKEGKPHYKR